MGCVFSKPSEEEIGKEGARGLQVQHHEYFNNNKHQVSMNHSNEVSNVSDTDVHCLINMNFAHIKIKCLTFISFDLTHHVPGQQNNKDRASGAFKTQSSRLKTSESLW